MDGTGGTVNGAPGHRLKEYVYKKWLELNDINIEGRFKNKKFSNTTTSPPNTPPMHAVRTSQGPFSTQVTSLAHKQVKPKPQPSSQTASSLPYPTRSTKTAYCKVLS
jgi:hypothetical protein